MDVDGYDVYSIDQTVDITVEYNGSTPIPAEASPREIGDHDGNGVDDLMVKFDRQAVYALLSPGTFVDLMVTGTLTDGNYFEGDDTVYVKDQGKDHTDETDPLSVEY